MKKFLPIALTMIITSAFLLQSCKKDKVEGEGHIISENRSATDFHQVVLNGPSAVTITYGNDFSVKVKAFENLIPQLETKVQNGALYIQYKKDANVTNDNAQISITMPSLTSVEVNGDGKLNTSGSFLGMEYFKASLTGTGEITLDKGSAKNIQIDNSGSGLVDAFGLTSDYGVVNINSSGDVRINAKKNLEANISGSGDIYYQGAPIIDSKISGGGQLIGK